MSNRRGLQLSSVGLAVGQGKFKFKKSIIGDSKLSLGVSVSGCLSQYARAVD